MHVLFALLAVRLLNVPVELLRVWRLFLEVLDIEAGLLIAPDNPRVVEEQEIRLGNFVFVNQEANKIEIGDTASP